MHEQHVGKAQPYERLGETRLAVVLRTVEVAVAEHALTRLGVDGFAADVLLGQQVGVLYLLGLIPLVVRNLDGTVADRAHAAVVACIVGIGSPVGPQLLAHGTVRVALYREWEGVGRGLAQSIELYDTVVAQLVVGTPSGFVRHLDGKHVLFVLIGLPIQAVVEVVLIVLSRVGVGVGPQVALVRNEAVAAVLDAVLEPGSHLRLRDAATLGQGQFALAIEACVEQPHAGHHALSSPLRGTAVAKLRILRGGAYLDGTLQVAGYLGIHLVGGRPRQVLGLGREYQGHAVEHLNKIEVVPRTEEVDFAEQLVLGLLVRPASHVVDGLESVVGAVDTGIALLPQGLHPVNVGIHQSVDALCADVTLRAAAQTVVGSDIEHEEWVFLGVGQVAIHHGVYTVHHLEGVGLVDREVRRVLHRQVLRVQEVVT